MNRRTKRIKRKLRGGSNRSRITRPRTAQSRSKSRSKSRASRPRTAQSRAKSRVQSRAKSRAKSRASRPRTAQSQIITAAKRPSSRTRK